jgi:hypothetical protein
MHRLVPLALLLGCHGGARTQEAPDERSLLDCVGTWSAADISLRLWGDHPDYAADDGMIWRDGDETQKWFHYYAVDHHLRLWMDGGRTVLDVPFRIEAREDMYVEHYTLVLDEPVLGHTRYTGSLAKSYRCEARRR